MTMSPSRRERGRESDTPAMGRDNPAMPGGVDQSVDRADEFDRALVRALDAAARRFDLVAQLARELEARRLAAAGNVVPMTPRRRTER
jgi:hypothetical protein